MQYYFNPNTLEEGLEILIPLLFSTVPSSVLTLVSYVLTSMALYALASRRGIRHGWLSWVPVLNVWIIGSLSDQYCYVVKGEYKSKRKILLILNLLAMLTGLVMTVAALCLAAKLVTGMAYGVYGEEVMLGYIIAVVCLIFPLSGLIIAAAIVRYMALYDVYRSMDPNNSILFLVLSIVFRVTEPFFLFFNRQKDEGMPPRRPEPQWMPPEQENSEYL